MLGQPLMVLGALVLFGISTWALLDPFLSDEGTNSEWAEIKIPLPFMPGQIQELIDRSKCELDGGESPYTPFFSCHTVVLPEIVKFSFIGSLFFTTLVSLSLVVLVPGWIYESIVGDEKFYVLGYEISSLWTKQVAFAAGQLREATPTKLDLAETSDVPPVTVELKQNLGLNSSETPCEREKEVLSILAVDQPKQISLENLAPDDPCEESENPVATPAVNDRIKDTKISLREAGAPDQLITSIRTEADIERYLTESKEYMQSLSSVVLDFAKLRELAKHCPEEHDHNDSCNNLSEEEADHVTLMAFHKYLEEIDIKDQVTLDLQKREILVEPFGLSAWDYRSPAAGWWISFIHQMHEILDPLKNLRFVSDLLVWIQNRSTTSMAILWRTYKLTGLVSAVLYNFNCIVWVEFWKSVSILIDAIGGPSESKRLKNAWMATGLFKNPQVSIKRRILEETSHINLTDRGHFLDAFDEEVTSLNDHLQARGLEPIPIVPQHRPVVWKTPVLTPEVASMLGFKEGEYVTDDQFNERVANFRAQGVPASADIVYKTPDPNFLAQSTSRYVPKYPSITPEKRQLAEDVALTLQSEFPELFENMEVLTFKQVMAYYVDKYAAGSPFISLYKTREALQRAGITNAIFDRALDDLREGKHRPDWFKAFLKAQVVDIDKVFNHGKPGRTVTAISVANYFKYMVLELERNKRHDWEKTGMGIGMPLNQGMVTLFNRLKEAQRDGAIFANADAHEYDSRTQPYTYEVLGKLAEVGFKHHLNGANLASVLKAKYHAMQDGFIFKETMPNYNNSISVITDKEHIRRLVRDAPDLFISTEQVLQGFPDYSGVDASKEEERQAPIHRLYRNKILLADQEIKLVEPAGQVPRPVARFLSPVWSVFTTNPDQERYNQSQNIIISPSYEDLSQNLQKLANNISIAYNVVHKNRGGGTGENATSWDNGWGYKSSFIAAWVAYHDFRFHPKEFFSQGNKLYNTGDDSAIALKLRWYQNTNGEWQPIPPHNERGCKDLKDYFNVQKFIECAHEYGIDLDFDFFSDLREVEYLGKSVRRPNRQDKRELEVWQHLDWLNRRSRDPEANLQQIPRFVVYQRTRQSWIRQSSNRYYQNAAAGRQWLHANVQKQVGTARISVFNRRLWFGLAHDYCEDITRLAGIYGVRNFRAEVKLDRWNLPFVRTSYDNTGVRSLKLLNKMVREETFSNRAKISKVEQFLLFLKHHATFPTYAACLHTHMRQQPEDPEEHARFLYKLQRKARDPFELAAFTVDTIQDYVTHNLPRKIYKFTPSLLKEYPEIPWYTESAWVEKMIMAFKGDNIKTLEEFVSAGNTSPWAIALNPRAFWDNFHDPQSKLRKEFENPPYLVDFSLFTAKERRKRAYANMVIYCYLIYFLLWYMERMIMAFPLIGVFYKCLMFTLIDLPKVYAIFSMIHWFAECSNSTVLAQLIPKDPYEHAKKFSMFLGDFLPLWLGDAPLITPYDICVLLVEPIKACSRLFTLGMQISTDAPTRQPESFVNPWDALVNKSDGTFQRLASQKFIPSQLPDSGLLDKTNEGESMPKPMIITAGTATGKSSLFPYSLLSQRSHLEFLGPILQRKPLRIIITFPRKVLVAKWSSPLDTGLYGVQRLDRSVKHIDPTARLLLGTDGHMLQRALAGQFNSEEFENLYLLDEFHELNGQKVALLQWLVTARQRVFLLSATPKGIDFIPTVSFDAGIPPRFSRRVIQCDNRDLSGVYIEMVAKEPEKARKCIIKTTYLAEAQKIKDQLTYATTSSLLNPGTWSTPAFKPHLLYGGNSQEPIPPDTTVLIATEVIGTGVSLPGYTMLISNGETLNNHKGEMVKEPTDANTEHQIESRVGRYQNGDIVVRPSWAGTGRTAQVYPDFAYLSYAFNARLHCLPCLVDLPNPKDSFWKFGAIKYMGVRKSLNSQILDRNVAGGIIMYHSLVHSGVRPDNLRNMYDRLYTSVVPEELEHLQRLVKAEKLHQRPWDEMYQFAILAGVIVYAMIPLNTKIPPQAQPYNLAELGHSELTSNFEEGRLFCCTSQVPLVSRMNRFVPYLMARGSKYVEPKEAEELPDYTDRVVAKILRDAERTIVKVSADAMSPEETEKAIKKLRRKVLSDAGDAANAILHKPTAGLPGSVYSYKSPDGTMSFSQIAQECIICRKVEDHSHSSEFNEEIMVPWLGKQKSYIFHFFLKPASDVKKDKQHKEHVKRTQRQPKPDYSDSTGPQGDREESRKAQERFVRNRHRQRPSSVKRARSHSPMLEAISRITQDRNQPGPSFHDRSGGPRRTTLNVHAPPFVPGQQWPGRRHGKSRAVESMPRGHTKHRKFRDPDPT